MTLRSLLPILRRHITDKLNYWLRFEFRLLDIIVKVHLSGTNAKWMAQRDLEALNGIKTTRKISPLGTRGSASIQTGSKITSLSPLSASPSSSFSPSTTNNHLPSRTAHDYDPPDAPFCKPTSTYRLPVSRH